VETFIRNAMKLERPKKPLQFVALTLRQSGSRESEVSEEPQAFRPVGTIPA